MTFMRGDFFKGFRQAGGASTSTTVRFYPIVDLQDGDRLRSSSSNAACARSPTRAGALATQETVNAEDGRETFMNKDGIEAMTTASRAAAALRGRSRLREPPATPRSRSL